MTFNMQRKAESSVYNFILLLICKSTNPFTVAVQLFDIYLWRGFINSFHLKLFKYVKFK